MKKTMRRAGVVAVLGVVGALAGARYRNQSPESYLEAAEAYVTALEKSRED